MTPEKIISIIEMYEAQLVAKNVPKVRMDTNRYFRDLMKDEVLAHAHYLCDGVKRFAKDPEKQRKTGSHLTAIQMCLGFAGLYTLEELMAHNRPEEKAPAPVHSVQGSNFGLPAWAT